MKQISLTLLTFLFSLAAFAQKNFKVPDFDAINKASNDPSSAFYFPRLREKFINNDKTPSVEDYQYVYYGSLYFQNREEAKDVRKLSNKISKLEMLKRPSEKTKRNLAEALTEYLQVNPLDLSALEQLLLLKIELKDETEIDIYKERAQKLIALITSTGDGRTETSGYYVVSLSDEHSFLRGKGFAMGFSSIDKDAHSSSRLKDANGNPVTVYFNEKLIFEKL